MGGPLQVSFVGGEHGEWQVERITAVRGAGLKEVAAVHMLEGPWPFGLGGTWMVRGVVSYARYTTTAEQQALRAVQEGLGRPSATSAALIPMSKSAAWWELAADERRAILQERSHHIAVGLRYLPAIARRLAHGHDQGEEFDFLTWFEFAPADAGALDELLGLLRETEEWTFVEREVEVRLTRA
ncbi:MAG TPA: chlorite dismutase family protein [Actinomycetota bacterium]|nr:chlorite dismutase family protein [Actinomycetota bacterium]